MLLSHLNAIEELLTAQSNIAKNAGHPNLRGGPREWFIREYLENHLPTILEIGQGEIIDENSRPNPDPDHYRPQVDLVIYRRDLPKILYAKNNSAFLAEGVKATIEVKSDLQYKDLERICKTSKIHKKLNRTRKGQKEIISYAVSYEGPSNMSTIANWLPKLVSENQDDYNNFVDMIIILGKGVVWKIKSFPEMKIPKISPETKWAFFDSKEKNLYFMFTHMLTWVSLSSPQPNIQAYASQVFFQDVKTI